jgi:hypothetical protein
MGHTEIDQTAANTGDQQANAAMMQVIIDTHGRPGEPASKTGTLASVNVEHYTTDEQSYNQFSNGVKFGVGPGAMTIEAPLGGKVVDSNGNSYGSSLGLEGAAKNGGAKVLDAQGHVVADIDKDKTLHVHTKNGEYTETKDGQVTFKPSGAAEDLSTLHKTGAVPDSKLQDYGVTKNGSVTRFGNGIEYDASTHKIIIPSEHANFHEDKKYSYKDDSLQATVGVDGDKVLYTQDANGLHIPTADGTITRTNSGAIRFDKSPAKSNALPDVTITGS